MKIHKSKFEWNNFITVFSTYINLTCIKNASAAITFLQEDILSFKYLLTTMFEQKNTK